MNEMAASAGGDIAAGSAGSLLIVDDDRPLRTRLATAMKRRGFDVSVD